MNSSTKKAFPLYRFIGGLRISALLYCERVYGHPVMSERYPVHYPTFSAFAQTCQLCGSTRLVPISA